MFHPFHAGLRRGRHRALVQIVGLLGREWRKGGTCDRGVGLHPAGGQGQLHEPLAQRAHVSLLEVLESFILVDFPRADPLHRGAPFGPHLLIGDARHVKCCSDTGVWLAPEILRLDFGFLVRWEIFTILESWRELLLHNAVVHLNFLALGLLTGNMGPSLMVLGVQSFIRNPGTPATGKRRGATCGLLVQGKEVAAVVRDPITELLLQQTL